MSDRLKIMISSRCKDEIEIGNEKLSFMDLRKEIKKRLEQEIFLSKKQFLEIKISEDFRTDFNYDSYEYCLQEINNADLVLVLFSGHAGGAAKYDSGIGICHAEYKISFNNFRSKTLMIDMRELNITPKYNDSKLPGDVIKRNQFFVTEVDRINRWYCKIRNNGFTKEEFLEYATKEVKETVRKGFIGLLSSAGRELLKANYSYGQALNWSKLNYHARMDEIRRVITEEKNKIREFGDIISSVSIVPDAMAVSEARDLAGRPFLTDHEQVISSKLKSGVIHFLGVYKNATEVQMRILVGHPDITVISDLFGYYVWDMINHVQIITLTNCRDAASTIIQMERFCKWASQSDEIELMKLRAKKRFKILSAVAQNLK